VSAHHLSAVVHHFLDTMDHRPDADRPQYLLAVCGPDVPDLTARVAALVRDEGTAVECRDLGGLDVVRLTGGAGPDATRPLGDAGSGRVVRLVWCLPGRLATSLLAARSLGAWTALLRPSSLDILVVGATSSGTAADLETCRRRAALVAPEAAPAVMQADENRLAEAVRALCGHTAIPQKGR
jgi:hypothetical protein